MRILIAILLVFGLSAQSFAQTTAPAAGGTSAGAEPRKGLNGPRRQFATIVFAGLGGAILGLSTLSFYGRPQDNLQNIPIGFGLGLLAGITLTTVRVINNPQELYGSAPHVDDQPNHSNAFQAANTAAGRTPLFKLSFDF